MRHIFTCALLLAALTDGARASDTHLILNRSYEYFPLPNYGGPDECDTSQLTDGFTHYTAGTIWRDKPTVGWSAGGHLGRPGRAGHALRTGLRHHRR